MVLLELHTVRANGILEGMALPHALQQVTAELRFLAHPVEVVQYPQALHGIQFFTAGVHVGQAAGDIVGDPVKEGTGLLNVLLMGGDGDIPLLHHAVGGIGDLVREHGIVLRTVAVKEVAPGRQKNGFLKVLAVDPLVVEGDLGRCPER